MFQEKSRLVKKEKKNNYHTQTVENQKKKKIEKKHFGGPEEKTPGPYHIFSFIPTQLNTLQKNFPSHFSPKFSIHPLSPPNKHTFRESSAQLELFSLF